MFLAILCIHTCLFFERVVRREERLPLTVPPKNPSGSLMQARSAEPCKNAHA
jgi:hypothetical protein